MSQDIGGDTVISSGVVLWDGKGAVRDTAPGGLETTFVLFGGSAGGSVKPSSNQGSIDVEIPGQAKVALSGIGNAMSGRQYRVAWAIERIGGVYKLTYTITAP